MGKHSSVFRWLNADGPSKAKCDCWVGMGKYGCPRHDPEVYARYAEHRADTTSPPN